LYQFQVDFMLFFDEKEKSIQVVKYQGGAIVSSIDGILDWSGEWAYPRLLLATSQALLALLVVPMSVNQPWTNWWGKNCYTSPVAQTTIVCGYPDNTVSPADFVDTPGIIAPPLLVQNAQIAIDSVDVVCL